MFQEILKKEVGAGSPKWSGSCGAVVLKMTDGVKLIKVFHAFYCKKENSHGICYVKSDAVQGETADVPGVSWGWADGRFLKGYPYP